MTSIFLICSAVGLSSHAEEVDCTPVSGRFAVTSNEDLDRGSYEVTMRTCALKNTDQKRVSLRRFRLRGEIMNWIVNTDTLQTSIVPDRCMETCSAFDPNSSSKYAELLTETTRIPSPTAGAGITKARSAEIDKIFLTVDLCPSTGNLQTEIFEKIQNGGMTNVPVALAVSGLWITHHRNELYNLLRLNDQKKIDITWVNHSMTHPYKPKQPIERNFLLSPGVNFSQEVLGNELVMFGQGLIPSVFFRFPGLISSDRLISQLKSWGLAPLGSNAWLGKGQKIKKGSIILVHGNGNELSGLSLLYKSLEVTPQLNEKWDGLNHIYNAVTDQMEKP